MHTGHPSDLAHQEALEILPWYVNGRLQPQELRRVEAHLGDCETCRAEADWLATLLETHAASIPERPVDSARLNNLFARIDRYESAQRRRSLYRRIVDPAQWRQWGERLMSGLTVRPALVAGAFAAVLLAVIIVPMVRSPQQVSAPYEVLGPAANELAVLVRFQTPQQARAVDQFVASSRAAGQFTGDYRIARRTSTEYRVILASKPGIEAVNRLVHEWRATPNVSEVEIDNTAGN